MSLWRRRGGRDHAPPDVKRSGSTTGWSSSLSSDRFENGIERRSRTPLDFARLLTMAKIQVLRADRPSNARSPFSTAKPGVLHDFLGNRVVVDEDPCEPEESAVVLLDQAGECRLVAGHQPSHEREIGGGCPATRPLRRVCDIEGRHTRRRIPNIVGLPRNGR